MHIYKYIHVCIVFPNTKSLGATESKGCAVVGHAKESDVMLTATRCNTLQYAATRCNTLQHTATHCTPLQHPCHIQQKTVATTVNNLRVVVTATSTTHCSPLQPTATHCNTHGMFTRRHRQQWWENYR